MSEQTTIRMTAQEYQQLPEHNQFQELIFGEVIVPPSPVTGHQRLILRLATLLQDVIPDGEVFIAPMDVHFDDENVLQPDVFWVAEEGACVERNGYFYGPPEIVIEVHSPSTMKQDKQTKFTIYEKHGVQAYWMVDPIGAVLEVWQLRDKQFHRVGVFGDGEQFRSALLKCDIQIERLFS